MQRLLSDRERQFTGRVMKVLTETLEFKSVFTTAYHPQTNGRLERFHRYLKERLAIRSVQHNLDFWDGDSWDQLLPSIVFSYNNISNKMTGYAPYEIVYGPKIRTPMDVILSRLGTQEQQLTNTGLETFVRRVKDEFRVVCQQGDQKQKQYDKQRKRYHKKSKSRSLSVDLSFLSQGSAS